MKYNGALRWAELWFDLFAADLGAGFHNEHAERQMWLALLFWVGMPCGQ